ncbi:hypothetical protein SEA_BARSTEN_83 [Gordonia Phage Barsten]|uniref:Uncharacterized protein n=1 Tax=Gordonia Phage Barsten TaxID=2743907 RepID=A0A7G3V9I0_9CAUD|nr:hypothetical protein KNV14_gp83 [Gordonia Phage Barsten]QKY78438.1 hypothetical protein SEA_BARSTEN_83 [Gordonia Phage Barsten]
MSRQARVRYLAGASLVIDVPDDVDVSTPAELLAWAEENADTYVTLCHQCAHEISLGDFEAHTVVDDAGEEHAVADIEAPQ